MAKRRIKRDTSIEPSINQSSQEARLAKAVSVRDFVAKYGGLTKEVFLKRYPHPFLIQVAKADDGGVKSGFFTAAVRDDRAPLNLSLIDRALFYVSKRAGTSFKSVISLGRQETCDIVIRSSVVSKSHAVLKRRKAQWTLIDGNSRNGTYLKGERLVPAKPYRLEPGMRIGLSKDLILVFMEASHAFEYLRWVKKKLTSLEENKD